MFYLQLFFASVQTISKPYLHMWNCQKGQNTRLYVIGVW